MADGGPAAASVSAIAARLDAPSGSIYHRFASRDLLIAHLWIRSVREAQVGFIEALQIDDAVEAAVQACLHMPRWSRLNVAKAQVLVTYRREDLVERWPAELGDELASLNTNIGAALESFTRRRLGTRSKAARQVVALALIDLPYASIRRYLHAGSAPPEDQDLLVAKTAAFILDSWSAT